jgi:hypothetical protein
MAQPIGDPARDERELTQLVKDLNEAVVKADVAVLDRVLHEDYVHHRPRGMVEDRAQYLENRKARRVDFESLVPDEIKVRVYGCRLAKIWRIGTFHPGASSTMCCKVSFTAP